MTIGVDRYPLVTIIMPVRNEASFVGRSLGAVLCQDYPVDRIEIVIVDGDSEDGTKQVIQRTVSERGNHYPLGKAHRHGATHVMVLDNPSRSAPAAMNIGLRHARGDIIIRVDGHCEIPPDYVRRCVKALEATGADCVGGALLTIGETEVARSIAAAQSSIFGVGGAAFRTGHGGPRYVDTVAFGAYRRQVFERIGGFDEELIRNQDDEFNLRLTQAGGRIWLDPSIRSVYYSRSSLGRLWRQYFQYGLYKVRVIQKRGAVPALRSLAPPLFVFGMLCSMLLAIASNQSAWVLATGGSYAVANLSASFRVATRRGWKNLLILPVVFATIHLSYGLGFWSGLWRFVVLSWLSRRTATACKGKHR